MKKLMLAAVVAGFGFIAAPAMAMPVGPATSSDLVTTVAGGCGPGWHRGPYGGCRPGGYYGRPVYRRGPVYGRPMYGRGYGYRRYHRW